MASNTENLIISPSPDPESSLIGCVEGLSVKLSEFYSDNDVTVKVNVFDENHPADAPETKSTKTLKFDFGKSNTKKVRISHNAYNIKLVNIGRKTWDGQDYPYFEFLIEW